LFLTLPIRFAMVGTENAARHAVPAVLLPRKKKTIPPIGSSTSSAATGSRNPL
jgi:hypothetical protein